MNYELINNEIWCVSTEKLVATLDSDGNPVMAPGMAGAHTRGVKAFLAELKFRQTSADKPAAPVEEKAEPEPERPQAPAAAESRPENAAPGIDRKEAELPPFDKALGTSTPGFQEYVQKHHLTTGQVAALVRKLERQ